MKVKYYLSFDVAYRSMAYYFAKVIDDKYFIPLLGNVKDFGDFDAIKTFKDITKFINAFEYFIIKLYQVKEKDLTVLIERQMGQNLRASEIQSVLISCFVKYPIIIVEPIRKCSKIFFNDSQTDINVWREKLKSESNITDNATINYRANKLCSAYTYKQIIKKCNFKTVNLKCKKRISDLADAFMQMLCYLMDDLKTPLIYPTI